MTIVFDIPSVIENRIRSEGRDPNLVAKQAAMVELYRKQVISHGELAQALGLSRCDADSLLKQHGVTEDLVGPDELWAQVRDIESRLGT